MQPITADVFSEVASQYGFKAEKDVPNHYGNGHINDTFYITHHNEHYILQRINTHVFNNPSAVMENMSNVTDFLAKKIKKAGGCPERETLTLIPTKEGNKYYIDSRGDFWRVFPFIENTMSCQMAENPEIFAESARAFGNFQRLLCDYPAETLHETIPHFHDTKSRFADFVKAVKDDKNNRAQYVKPEIDFVMKHEKDTSILVDLLEENKLPLRVTHNDTKLNNVLLDAKTGKTVCVIDLDTVMPGLSLYDYGDSIRFGASSATEDEKDLDSVYMNLDLFEAYTEGFLEMAGDSMTDLEKEHLPTGAKLMTLECGMRFLGDYLDGDNYFRIHYDGQNLDRARTQLKLVADMESKWDDMHNIVRKYS